MNKYKFTYISSKGNHTWVTVLAATQVEAEAKIEKYLPNAIDVELVEEFEVEE